MATNTEHLVFFKTFKWPRVYKVKYNESLMKLLFLMDWNCQSAEWKLKAEFSFTGSIRKTPFCKENIFTESSNLETWKGQHALKIQFASKTWIIMIEPLVWPGKKDCCRVSDSVFQTIIAIVRYLRDLVICPIWDK